MKVIRKRIPARTQVVFQCEVCGARYRTAKRAKECEDRFSEMKLYRKKEKVRIVGHKFHCDSKNEDFIAEGRIRSVEGPCVADEDYERRWLGGDMVGCHVYYYIVNFDCVCGEARSSRVRTTELALTLA